MQQPAERDSVFEREALACLPEVVRFARSLTRDEADADDLVQQTYLLAYRGYTTFRPGATMRSWLFGICHHAWTRDAQRRKRMVLESDTANAEVETIAAVRGHAAAQSAGLDRFITGLDLAPAIDAAIQELDPVFRSIVLLVDVEGLSYAEAAAVLQVPVGTVRSRLFRARRLLQERLLAFAYDAGFLTSPPSSHPSSQ